jgi:hypothetical protein
MRHQIFPKSDFRHKNFRPKKILLGQSALGSLVSPRADRPAEEPLELERDMAIGAFLTPCMGWSRMLEKTEL